MSTVDVKRAWRDGEYYLGLTAREQEQVPVNPAGMIEFANGELTSFIGEGCTDTHQSWCYNSLCASKCSCIC